MEIICPKCSTVTACPIDFEVIEFGCPGCNKLLDWDAVKQGSQLKQFEYDSPDLALSIGQKGTLEGKEYVVTGILVKRVQGIYYWREYVLKSTEGENRYLSETDGHWILLKEVPETYDVEHYPRKLTHDNITMSLYDYENTAIAQAIGFFDYNLPIRNQEMIEYVNAPYIISIEKEGNKETTFFGEHISRNKVKKIFGVAKMPAKAGVGIVQPFFFNIRNLGIILSCASLLILFTHLYVYDSGEEKHVLRENLTFSQYGGKDYVTKSFTLEGGSAPLTVSLQSNVNNSWANVQVGLVNEQTKEEVYANKDIEYYSGYEDGSAWSEGSTGEKFNICGVAAGRYHLVITPQKAPEDMANDRVGVNVVWNEPSMWNVFLPILLMGIFVVIVYFVGAYFEQKRWADSSFSPFEE